MPTCLIEVMWPTVSVILRQVYSVQQIWKKGARNSHKAEKVFRKVLLTNNFILPSMVNSLTTCTKKRSQIHPQNTKHFAQISIFVFLMLVKGVAARLKTKEKKDVKFKPYLCNIRCCGCNCSGNSDNRASSAAEAPDTLPGALKLLQQLLRVTDHEGSA